MNVRQLKELVNSIPSELNDIIVILQKDPEGNGYNPLRGIDFLQCFWNDEDVISSNQYDSDEWEDLMSDEPEPCVVIYP